MPEQAGAARPRIARSASTVANYLTLIAALGQTGEIVEAHAVMTDAMDRFGEAALYDLRGMV